MSPWRVAFVAVALIIPIAASQVGTTARPATMRRPPYGMGMYDGYRTPAWVLRGIAIAESGEDDMAVGDDGTSIGRMQLNERFHDERVRLYGGYDPRSANDSIRIASCIFQDSYSRLGHTVAAIDAHRQGVSGVNTHGISGVYVNRVIRYGNGGER